MAVDLDDTSKCPQAAQCESCEATTDLDMVTLGTPVGVYCLTLCGTCVGAARFPKGANGWATTAALVMRHCGHLAIDLDEMATALDQEAGR